MENTTSKINCFVGEYYGYEPSFGMADVVDWQRAEFDTLKEAIQFVEGEDDGEVLINGKAVFKDGKFVKSEDEIIRMVKEAESSYISWLQKELDRMLK